MSIAAWASAPSHQTPEPVRPATCGADGCAHAQCEVAYTGGEVLCRLAGGDWAALPMPARDHYAAIAMAAMTTMWDRAVEVGMTADVTITDQEPST